MKPVIITEMRWHNLLIEMYKDYPKSVLAIREKTKKVLGFTSRSHRTWIENPMYNEFMKQYANRMDDMIIPTSRGYYSNMIHLDFYSEPKRTFFLLKYSEFLS